MESIEPEDNQNSEPVAATRVETHRVRPSILHWLVGIALVIVLAVLLVLLGRWIYHATHHKAAPKTVSSQKTSTSSSQKKGSSSPKTANNNPPSSPSSSNPSSNNPQISNTGPGDVVAIFVGASLMATGLHFIWSLRRSQDY